MPTQNRSRNLHERFVLRKRDSEALNFPRSLNKSTRARQLDAHSLSLPLCSPSDLDPRHKVRTHLYLYLLYFMLAKTVHTRSNLHMTIRIGTTER